MYNDVKNAIHYAYIFTLDTMQIIFRKITIKVMIIEIILITYLNYNNHNYDKHTHTNTHTNSKNNKHVFLPSTKLDSIAARNQLYSKNLTIKPDWDENSD
jgi:hypothetical protein